MEKYKVVIVGAGIAGMSAAINLKRAGINPLIIENNAPGGTLNYIPNIENYPGFESISGPDLAMNIYNQVNNLDIKIKSANISDIDLDKKYSNLNDYDFITIGDYIPFFGVLLKKKNIFIEPLINGGKSVTKYRSGTSPTSLIVSFSKFIKNRYKSI